LQPVSGAGEVGHGAAVLHDGELVLFFQERTGDGPWRYGIATAPVEATAQRRAS
jgi:hypothetical protein